MIPAAQKISAPYGTGFLWQIVCKVSAAAVEPFEEYLRRYCGAVSATAGVKDTLWRIEGLTDVEPDREIIERGARALARDIGLDVPTFVYDLRPPVNWLAENLASFPPVRHGRYFIHGTHFNEPLPGGVTPLQLDAGTAFGSGEHPTTAGCLLVLDRLAKEFRFARPLDVGCGSGILAIAAAKTWGAPVLASDIDPESVAVTRANAKQNNVAHLIQAVESNGYKHRNIFRGGPFDLVTANILARPLAKLARDLGRVIAPGGIAILSGVVERDAAWMIRVHRLVGFHLLNHTVIKGWSTLVLEKRRRTGD
ncbi:MAG: 50S ribosomal protein L11 methyltransferase [Rhodospirillales bacterium]|nr:50S ribosomal protein L11 methyltransferase [Rhodospirillales bacterium]